MHRALALYQFIYTQYEYPTATCSVPGTVHRFFQEISEIQKNDASKSKEAVISIVQFRRKIQLHALA